MRNLIFLIFFLGCKSYGITDFKPVPVFAIQSDKDYEPFTDKICLKELKKDWKKLGIYIEKGHLRARKPKSNRKGFSCELITYIFENYRNFYNVPYLQDIEHIECIFGEGDKFVGEQYTEIYYSISVMEPIYCNAADHNLLGFYFHTDTGKMVTPPF